MRRLTDERESKLRIVQGTAKLDSNGNYARAGAIGLMGAVSLGLWAAVPHGEGAGYALLASLILSVVCWVIMGKAGFADSEDCSMNLTLVIAGGVWVAGAITWLWAAAVALFGGGVAAVKWNIWTNLAFFRHRCRPYLSEGLQRRSNGAPWGNVGCRGRAADSPDR